MRIESPEDPRTQAMVGALTPFVGYGRFRTGEAAVQVLLAPQECGIAFAARRENPSWSAPVVGYVTLRDPSQDKVVRVVCAGIVRYQGEVPTTGVYFPQPVSEEQVVAAGAARAQGATPNVDAKNMLQDHACDRPVAQSMLLFGGPVPGLESEGEFYVAICPTSTNAWFVRVLKWHNENGLGFWTDADLSLETSIVVIPPSIWPGDVHLVLAPRNAVRLEVSDLDGHVLDTPSMGSGVAAIHLAFGQKVKLRAFDAGGKEVGAGVVPMPIHPPVITEIEQIENWS